MNIDYKNLKEITVKSQEELDKIPLDFKGKIYIEFGTYFDPAIIRNKYYYNVVARGNSSVEARGNSSVEAWGNSSVEAWGNSHVEAQENSHVVASENSHVVAQENSHVVAWGNSHVVARGNSHVKAWGNSHVEAQENSHVEAWGNSSVEASGNTQIVDYLFNGKIEVTGNARIVYMPKTIEEYCVFYNLEHNKNTGKFYKCVHKKEGKYFSDKDEELEYIIGKIIVPDYFDYNINEDCGHGIHVAYLNWALDYGSNWEDLAILEVESNLNDIIIPVNCPGKVRCKEVKVLREVPLEECGLYGKILAKRNKGRD